MRLMLREPRHRPLRQGREKVGTWRSVAGDDLVRGTAGGQTGTRRWTRVASSGSGDVAHGSDSRVGPRNRYSVSVHRTDTQYRSTEPPPGTRVSIHGTADPEYRSTTSKNLSNSAWQTEYRSTEPILRLRRCRAVNRFSSHWHIRHSYISVLGGL
jgi:hypothetical protein